VPLAVAPGADDRPVKTTPELLISYYNPDLRDYRIVTESNDLRRGREGYKVEAIQGYIFKQRATDTIPLYHYFHKGRGDHLVTRNFTEFRYGKDGYDYKGILGFIYKNRRSGTVPLYRYFSKRDLDTRLTTDFQKLKGNRGIDGYEYSTIQGYVPAYVPPGMDAPVTKSVPRRLVRYYNDKARNHVLRVGRSDLRDGRDGYKPAGDMGYIYSKRARGTVPLYHYYHAGRPDSLYTLRYTEFGRGNDGYKYEGVLGYVYPREQRNTAPLMRYFGSWHLNTRITSDRKELEGKKGGGGYQYAGIEGWVLSLRAPDAEISGPDPERKELARYFNHKLNDYRFMAGKDEYGEGRFGYVYQGSHGYVFTRPGPGRLPLYQHFHPGREDSILTLNPDELSKAKNGYEYQGILGYVYASEQPGSAPLRRYFNRGSIDTRMTTSATELNGARGDEGYYYARNEGWVPQ
jgi:hypothetical protein